MGFDCVLDTHTHTHLFFFFIKNTTTDSNEINISHNVAHCNDQ